MRGGKWARAEPMESDISSFHYEYQDQNTKKKKKESLSKQVVEK